MAQTPTYDDWKTMAAGLSLEGKAFIGGKFVPALSGKTFAAHSPIDGRALAAVAACEAEDVDLAVKAARAAFESGVWSGMAPRERMAVLLRFADLMEKHAGELALIDTLDMGKPIAETTGIDVPASILCMRFFAQAIDKINDEIPPTASNAVAMVVREPIGVIGAVVPWNYPLMMAVWKLAPILATGNCVVLKPAEQSPLSALRMAALAAEAGIPEGVFNVVPGFGETAGQALGLHMDVDAIAFTGSTEVGKYFLKYAGQSNMKRVSLECGGKSPHIVMPDTPDLDRVAGYVADGIFCNQGEVCNAGSRLVVHESIKDELLSKVVALAEARQPGDPLDPDTAMGAMVDETQMTRVLGYIDIGKGEGATVATGGERKLVNTGGYYIAPTVLDGVKNSMRVAQEEIFGPVLSTITFKDYDEAIAIANDTIYGLHAAIWTSDINTAMRAGRALRAGGVTINGYDGGDITTPFGGFKQSGFGRDNSLHAMEKYTDLKMIWVQLHG